MLILSRKRGESIMIGDDVEVRVVDIGDQKVRLGVMGPASVPVHLRDSHYAGAKRLGHGEGYQYAHDHREGIASQDYLGVEREYFRPVQRGFERELAQRLAAIRARLREGKRETDAEK